MTTNKIIRIARKLDVKNKERIISKYMSDMGKKSASINIKKGTKHFSNLAKKRWTKYYTRKKTMCETISECLNIPLIDVVKWKNKDIETEYYKLIK